MPAWDVTLADSLSVDHYEREIKRCAGKAHDLAFDDPAEALHQIDCLAGYASEWKALVTRRAESERERMEGAEARREMASAVGPRDPVRC